MEEKVTNFEFPFDWVEIIEDKPFENIMDNLDNDGTIESKLREEEIKLLEKIRKKHPNFPIEDIKFYRIWITKFSEFYCFNDIIDFLVVRVSGKYYVTSVEENFNHLLKYSELIKKRFKDIQLEISLLKQYENIIYEIMDSAPALRIFEVSLVDV